MGDKIFDYISNYGKSVLFGLPFTEELTGREALFPDGEKVCFGNNLAVKCDDDLFLADVGGSVLVVSQFTLYADCRKGYRPSFVEAAPGQQAETLYEYFLERCRESGLPVEHGAFGAHMEISLINDGPFTIVWEENV